MFTLLKQLNDVCICVCVWVTVCEHLCYLVAYDNLQWWRFHQWAEPYLGLCTDHHQTVTTRPEHTHTPRQYSNLLYSTLLYSKQYTVHLSYFNFYYQEMQQRCSPLYCKNTTILPPPLGAPAEGHSQGQGVNVALCQMVAALPQHQWATSGPDPMRLCMPRSAPIWLPTFRGFLIFIFELVCVSI